MVITVAKPFVEEEEINAVVEVLKSGMIAQGSKTKEFEENFAKYCGTKHAVALSNGTAAIHAGLYALGVGPEHEVITTPFTFVGTANPILMQGGKVVFADIREDDFCLDPEEVEKKVSNKTKAIIPVDLYGQIYRVEEMMKVVSGTKIVILEDACQAIGAERNGKKAGRFGEAGVFSLYATKNITTAEGGMLVTDDEKIAEKCRMFRHHGQLESKRYEYLELGYNYRMTDITAAIGVEQLKKVGAINAIRVKNANLYNDSLDGIEGLILPKVMEGNTHVYHQYTIRVTEKFALSRDELIEHLREEEIGVGVYYPKPLHLHAHFKKMGYKKGDFPVSEKISKEVLSLPVHACLSESDISSVIDSIRNLVK